jgi:hypothetical protein
MHTVHTMHLQLYASEKRQDDNGQATFFLSTHRTVRL